MTAPTRHQPTPLARRVGPVVAVVALLVGVGTVAWTAFGPTSVEDTLAALGQQVPGRLLVQPAEDGCLVVVDGDGEVRERCDEDWPYALASWTPDGTILLSGVGGQAPEPVPGDEEAVPELPAPADRGEPLLPSVLVDPDTFVVTPTDLHPRDVEELRSPTVESTGREEVTVDGTVVLRLTGPPGTRLLDAATSPDRSVVVATDEDGRVLVAGVDGDLGPAVWYDPGEEERFVFADSAVLWDASVGGPGA